MKVPSDGLRRFSWFVRQAARSGQLTLLAVLYMRVSSGRQWRAGNAEHQLRCLHRRVRRIGRKYGVTNTILDDFDEGYVSGWVLWPSGRPELVKAAKLARKHNAVLVALNTSRLVRNRDYQRHGTAPTIDDFEKLMAMVGGARLATVLDPNTPEDKPEDTERGLAAAKKRGVKLGRPPKRQYGPRMWDLPKATKLAMRQMRADDKSYREIGTALKLSKSQVGRYLSIVPQSWIDKLRSK